MGMAASQARLLCITARIHDVEYQAQAIQNAKVQLATQSDQVYQEYLDALDATTLTVTTMSGEGKSTVTATFNNLFSRNRVRPANGDVYALRNEQGLLVVEDDIFEGYEDFTDAGLDDPYEFATFMMGGDSGQNIGNLEDGDFEEAILAAEDAVYNNLDETEKSSRLIKLHDKLLELTGNDNIYDANELISSGDKEKIKEYDETLAAYRKELYKSHAAQIYDKANQGNGELIEDFDSSLFNFFADIYKQIKNCGGCISIDEYNGGPTGDAANNNQWLQNMIQSGQFAIETVKYDDDSDEVLMTATSPSSDISLGYTETTTIDKTALAKAEAKYEHDLKQIDKKDKQYDLTLSKLETERSALTTEYDSVKKVVQDNVERTFGIFS